MRGNTAWGLILLTVAIASVYMVLSRHEHKVVRAMAPTAVSPVRLERRVEFVERQIVQKAVPLPVIQGPLPQFITPVTQVQPIILEPAQPPPIATLSEPPAIIQPVEVVPLPAAEPQPISQPKKDMLFRMM